MSTAFLTISSTIQGNWLGVGSAPNHTCVDEGQPPSSAEYVLADTIGLVDEYGIAGIPADIDTVTNVLIQASWSGVNDITYPNIRITWLMSGGIIMEGVVNEDGSFGSYGPLVGDLTFTQCNIPGTIFAGSTNTLKLTAIEGIAP